MEVQTPANFREGDWMCTSCGAHNYASKQACFKCYAGKDGKKAEAWGGQEGAEKPENFRPGDWMCSCGAHNYASKNQCHKCGVPKMMVPPTGSDAATNFRPGDWMCPCGAHNYANKMACHKCGTAKQMAAMGMSGMGGGMGAPSMHGGMGMGMMGMGGGMPANFRQGDWMCTSCGQHNFASKTNCHKCGAMKPAQQPAQGGYGQAAFGAQQYGSYDGQAAAYGGYGGLDGMMGMMGQPAMGGGMGGYGGTPANFRPGDWMCRCGAHNYASKSACHKCGTAKETGAGGAGPSGYAPAAAGGTPANFRAGDWMCACGAHNYASKTACHKCSAPKP